MTWLALALLSAIMLTLVNFGDKWVLERFIPDSRALLVYIAVVDGFTGILLWFLAGAEFFPFMQGFLLIMVGFTIVLANLFYFNAIQLEETSRVIVWLQFTPIPTLIMSLIILNETPVGEQWLGFMLIFVAAVLTARGKGNGWRGILRLSPAFGLVLLATVLWSIENLLIDQSMAFSDVANDPSLAVLARTAAYTSIGHSLGVVVLVTFSKRVRESFLAMWAKRRPSQWMALALLQITFISRQFVHYMALALGPVALVTVIGSTQVLWGIFFGWLLTLFAPAIFKEDITRAGLLEKSALALMTFVGILLIG
jgi:uncharacterized membrane protein